MILKKPIEILFYHVGYLQGRGPSWKTAWVLGLSDQTCFFSCPVVIKRLCFDHWKGGNEYQEASLLEDIFKHSFGYLHIKIRSDRLNNNHWYYGEKVENGNVLLDHDAIITCYWGKW